MECKFFYNNLEKPNFGDRKGIAYHSIPIESQRIANNL